MGATGVTFLWIGGDQVRPGEDSIRLRVRVFFSDMRDKPARSGRYERSKEAGSADAAGHTWLRRRAGREDWVEDCAFGIREEERGERDERKTWSSKARWVS